MIVPHSYHLDPFLKATITPQAWFALARRAGHGPDAPRPRDRPARWTARWSGAPLAARAFAVAALPYAALLVAAGILQPLPLLPLLADGHDPRDTRPARARGARHRNGRPGPDRAEVHVRRPGVGLPDAAAADRDCRRLGWAARARADRQGAEDLGRLEGLRLADRLRDAEAAVPRPGRRREYLDRQELLGPRAGLRPRRSRARAPVRGSPYRGRWRLQPDGRCRQGQPGGRDRPERLVLPSGRDRHALRPAGPPRHRARALDQPASRDPRERPQGRARGGAGEVDDLPRAGRPRTPTGPARSATSSGSGRCSRPTRTPTSCRCASRCSRSSAAIQAT